MKKQFFKNGVLSDTNIGKILVVAEDFNSSIATAICLARNYAIFRPKGAGLESTLLKKILSKRPKVVYIGRSEIPTENFSGSEKFKELSRKGNTLFVGRIPNADCMGPRDLAEIMSLNSHPMAKAMLFDSEKRSKPEKIKEKLTLADVFENLKHGEHRNEPWTITRLFEKEFIRRLEILSRIETKRTSSAFQLPDKKKVRLEIFQSDEENHFVRALSNHSSNAEIAVQVGKNEEVFISCNEDSRDLQLHMTKKLHTNEPTTWHAVDHVLCSDPSRKTSLVSSDSSQNKKTPLPELIQRKISAMFSDFTQKTTETSIPATNGHANGKEQPVTSINIPAIHVNGNGMPKEALAAA